jgi:ubiquinone/menaquinone biosynthesis C-methylase UbiE
MQYLQTICDFTYMELTDAVKLIKNGIPQITEPQNWADIGAGTGMFTHALASLLPPHSIVYALDRDKAALSKISNTAYQVTVEKIAADFVADDLGLKGLNGIVLANAIHFVDQPAPVLKKLKTFLNFAGRLILIEYDMDTPNRWVPYPVSFRSLTKLAARSGFAGAVKIGEHPSIYHRANIYAAVLQDDDVRSI